MYSGIWFAFNVPAEPFVCPPARSHINLHIVTFISFCVRLCVFV